MLLGHNQVLLPSIPEEEVKKHAASLPLMGSDPECPSSSSPLQQIDDRCNTCNSARSLTLLTSLSLWKQSSKRKLDQMEDYVEGSHRLQMVSRAPAIDVPARVVIENECAALRETLARQQMTINDLYMELEEERDASSSAANEAMSMILRLQGEKAEVQMEATQFKRFAEEKMAHDQQEILTLEDVRFKREEELKALTFEVQTYKHRLMSCGVDPDSGPHEGIDEWIDKLGDKDVDDEDYSIDNSDNNGCETPGLNRSFYDYPPLRCRLHDIDMNDELIDPCTPVRNAARERLHHIEQQMYLMERPSSNGQLNILDKGVVMGCSPGQPKHFRQWSVESTGSLLGQDMTQDYGPHGKRQEELSSIIKEDVSNRICTIDMVYGEPQNAPAVAFCGDFLSTSRDLDSQGNAGIDEPDIKKLYTRLQALEADRESLKQAIIAMQTDNAQIVLLKEIAQNLSKGVPRSVVPERRLVKRPLLLLSFCFISLAKWIASLNFWKRKVTRIKYSFGFSSSSAGLLHLLDTSPTRIRPWRCVNRLRG